MMMMMSSEAAVPVVFACAYVCLFAIVLLFFVCVCVRFVESCGGNRKIEKNRERETEAIRRVSSKGWY